MSQGACKLNTIPELSVQLNCKDWYASTRTTAERPPLTELEKTRPFAKYYRDPVPPDPAHLAKMDAPCDPAKAIFPEQINELLNPGYLDVEVGWCNLPNGAGFIANCYQYEGVTAEMVDWWFAWHSLENLRYRIWYPPQHGGLMLSPESRKRLLDPKVPIREKNWNVIHHVTENCNSGMENVDINFLSPADFGFDMTRFKEPEVATFHGGYGWACSVNKTGESITAPAMMCHIFRNIPGGIEHRTRFWMGYRRSNGKPELSLPPGVQVPAVAVQGLARHNVCEFKNLSVLLPEIYKELGGRMKC